MLSISKIMVAHNTNYFYFYYAFEEFICSALNHLRVGIHQLVWFFNLASGILPIQHRHS